MPRSSRGIRIVESVLPDDRVPIVRRLAPGTPLFSEGDVETMISTEAAVALLGIRPDFLLRIDGDFVGHADLHHGDLVAVRTASDAREGQMVVACVDGEIAVGLVALDDDRTTLVGGSPERARVQLSDKRSVVVGVVIASVRSHRTS